jgi:hypothetical protein
LRARRAGGRPLLLLTLPADAYSSSSSDRDTCNAHMHWKKINKTQHSKVTGVELKPQSLPADFL